MKTKFFSRKFLTGAFSLFIFFSLLNTSFFFFSKEANALGNIYDPVGTKSPDTTVCNANVFAGGLVICGKGDSPEDCTFEAFICLLQRIMNFLLFVLAVPLAAISFAWAGWLYLSAAGNESKIKQAHEIFGTVALGLCIALAAWLIVHAVIKGLGVAEQYNFLGN